MFRCLFQNFFPVGTKSIASVPKLAKIGIIGCGNVGNAVANNLIRKGFPIVGMCDPDKNKLEAMPKGIQVCSTPREVAESCDVCITGLPKPPHVKEAAEGPDGILKGLSKDKIWIDHSTTDHQQTLDFDHKARALGAHVLEAPITGGMVALRKGQMVVHVGGEREVAEAVRPILEASYMHVFYVGPIGSAMLIKVVSNMLAAVNIIAAGEVLLLAKRSNIDLKTFWEAVRVSAGNSFVWETGVPGIFQGTYEHAFKMDLFCKDMQLGYDIARELKVPMDLNQTALFISRRALYQFGEELTCYGAPKLYEEALKESLNIPGFEDWTYENEIKDGSICVKHKNVK